MNTNRKPLKVKFILFCILILTLILTIVYVIMYITSKNIIENQLGINAQSVAVSAAHSLMENIEEYKIFLETRDADSEYYKRMQNYFVNIKAGSNIKFIFTEVRIDSETIEFILDSEPIGSQEYSPPGSTGPNDWKREIVYSSQKPSNFKVYDHPVWGKIIAAYAPLFDENGEMLGILGVNIDSNKLFDQLNYLFTIMFVTYVVLTAVVLVVLIRFSNAIVELLERLAHTQKAADKSAALSAVLQNLMDAMDTYLFVAEIEAGRILFVNNKMKERFKLDDSVIGTPCHDVINPFTGGKYGFCIKGNPVEDSEAAGSSDIQVNINGNDYKKVDRTIHWSDGRTVHLQYFIDITELKQTEASLKRQLMQEELMSSISQSFIDEDDIAEFMKTALQLAGEFVGISRILIAQYIEDEKALALRYSWNAKGEPVDVEHFNRLPFYRGAPMCDELISNNYMPLAVSDTEWVRPFQHVDQLGIKAFLAVPLYVSGRFWGIMELDQCEHTYSWSESDIHLGTLLGNVMASVLTRQNTEREIVKAKEAAENASRAKSEFLSRMSHEMRTPMNAIIGMTSIAKKSGDLKKKEYCLDKINDASKHLLGVINDILDMSKIEANKFELSIYEFGVGKMLEGISNIASFHTGSKGQTFFINVDKEVPQSLIGDELRLSQVITNLLSNAAKFTPDNGTITLNLKKLDEKNDVVTLQISVEDNGIGIPTERQASLFDSFEQADGGIARKYGGTGLGLAISKHIAELMGGRIWVESEPGVGSKFFFTAELIRGRGQLVSDTLSGFSGYNLHIPFEDDFGNGTAAGAPERGENAAAGNDFSGRRMLLAEDIDINREIVSSILENTGISIDYAENGKEAADLFKADPDKYDIILMDIHMPGMDGYEATRAIRSIKSRKAANIPIIAMTANVFKEDIEKCLEAGMDDHIGKPVDADALLVKVREHLSYLF